MPKLLRAVPVLASLDIERSIAFYTRTLGFREVLCRPREYGIVSRDDIVIHFWACSDPAIAEATSCRIVVKGIDELFAELEPRGVVHPRGQLANKPWGMRELAIVDGDGNLITFCEPLDGE